MHPSFYRQTVPIANGYRKTPSGDYEFDVKGIACSFPCAQKHINKTPKNDRWELEKILCVIFCIFYDKKVESIPEAYDQYELERFGGNISDADYDARNKYILETLTRDEQTQ